MDFIIFLKVFLKVHKSIEDKLGLCVIYRREKCQPNPTPRNNEYKDDSKDTGISYAASALIDSQLTVMNLGGKCNFPN